MDKVLQAYGYAALAKDASGKYMNVRRTLRNYEDIMEAARGDDMKETFQEQVLAAIKEGLAQKDANTLAEANPVKVDEKTTLHTKPQFKHDNTKLDAKEFYKFTKESKDVMNAMMVKLDALAPPPAKP